MRLKKYHKPKEFSEDAVVQRIEQGRGLRHQVSFLAKYFSVSCDEMRAMLLRLADKQRIRKTWDCGRIVYYLPSEEEQVKAELARQRREDQAWSALATLKIWRPGDPDPA